MFLQLLAFAGAACVLLAFAASQAGRLDRTDWRYNLLNLVGAACLGWVALADRRWGFVVLQAAWIICAAVMLRPRSAGGLSHAAKRELVADGQRRAVALYDRLDASPSPFLPLSPAQIQMLCGITSNTPMRSADDLIADLRRLINDVREELRHERPGKFGDLEAPVAHLLAWPGADPDVT